MATTMAVAPPNNSTAKRYALVRRGKRCRAFDKQHKSRVYLGDEVDRPAAVAPGTASTAATAIHTAAALSGYVGEEERQIDNEERRRSLGAGICCGGDGGGGRREPGRGAEGGATAARLL